MNDACFRVLFFPSNTLHQALEDGYLTITGVGADDNDDYETVLKNSNSNSNSNSNDVDNDTGYTGGDDDQYAHDERMQGKPGGSAVGTQDETAQLYNTLPAGTAMTYDDADAARPYSDVNGDSKEYVHHQGDLDAYIASGVKGAPCGNTDC